MILMRGAPDFERVFGPTAGDSLLRSPHAVTNRNSVPSLTSRIAQSGRHRDLPSSENRNGRAAHSTADSAMLRYSITRTQKNGSEGLKGRGTQREGSGEKHNVLWSAGVQCSHDDSLVSRGTAVGWEFSNYNPRLRQWTIDRNGEQRELYLRVIERMTEMRAGLKVLMRCFRTGRIMESLRILALEVRGKNRMDRAAMIMTRIPMIGFGMDMEERDHEHPDRYPREDQQASTG